MNDILKECIHHKDYDSPRGYGRRVVGKQVVGSHRVVYCEHNNVSLESIKGMHVRHICDNPRCINPEHLELGTHKENTHDMLIRGRHTNSVPTGELHGGCKLTDTQVRDIRQRYKKGSRTCGSTKLAAEFGVTHTQILGIVKGLYRTQGSILKEQTAWA